jgi:TRAP-type C4-dicarboxylate transport system permease small subunit
MPDTPPAAADDHVLTSSGEFDVRDEPIDLRAYRFEDWIALGFFWLLAATVFLQFFTRYALNDSAGWTEEIARYLLIVVTFVGSAMGVRRNTHIHVEFVYRYLPAGVQRTMSTLVDLARIALFGYGTWLSIELVPRMHNLLMTVIDFPVSYVYAFVAVGFALMTFRAVQVAWRHWRQGWSVLERPGEAEA